MLGCLSASCVWLLLFGLAPSLTFAVVCRFAHGLCGGNVVVAKAMMADITDRSNETRAFVFVGLAFGAGAMLGPLIGGTLAQPASKYPYVFDAPLWRRKPYLLPCLVVALLMVADLVTAYFLLQESREERPYKRAHSPSDVEKIAAAEGLAPTTEENDDDDDEESPSLRDLLLNARSPFKRVCASHVLFGACYMAYQECFPLFCRKPPRGNESMVAPARRWRAWPTRSPQARPRTSEVWACRRRP